MKKPMVLFVLLFLFGSLTVEAKVVNQHYQKLYGAHFWIPKFAVSEQSKYVMTDFGPGNIRFLERIDIVIDNEMRVNGIRIFYTTGDGIKRQVYLHQIKGWILESPPSPKSVSKKVLIQTITTDELSR
ncbi:MAG: hypothetical protein J7J46_02095 [Candidatus Desulfofervidus sp.]|nr:hypothetical protein [Candidatus Desulfofervidus sp.]